MKRGCDNEDGLGSPKASPKGIIVCATRESHEQRKALNVGKRYIDNVKRVPRCAEEPNISTAFQWRPIQGYINERLNNAKALSSHKTIKCINGQPVPSKRQRQERTPKGYRSSCDVKLTNQTQFCSRGRPGAWREWVPKDRQVQPHTTEFAFLSIICVPPVPIMAHLAKYFARARRTTCRRWCVS